eukprot:15463297-Alexandrium_andersonii.AAC.1
MWAFSALAFGHALHCLGAFRIEHVCTVHLPAWSQTIRRARVYLLQRFPYILYMAIGRYLPDAPCHDCSRIRFVTGGVDSLHQA